MIQCSFLNCWEGKLEMIAYKLAGERSNYRVKTREMDHEAN